jgi:prevent-host-death family protein
MKIEQVTNLKRQATKILDDLRQSKESVVITEHGKPSAVMMDVEEYVTLHERVKLLEEIALGERAIAEGRVVSQEEARHRLSKWLE